MIPITSQITWKFEVGPHEYTLQPNEAARIKRHPSWPKKPSTQHLIFDAALLQLPSDMSEWTAVRSAGILNEQRKQNPYKVGPEPIVINGVMGPL